MAPNENEENLEQYSVETPVPPSFLPYEAGVAPVSYEDGDNSNNSTEDEGEMVRHRSPRFWFLTVGALALVVAAVGGGVGVAMSGGSSVSSSSAQSYSRPTSTSVEEELVGEVMQDLEGLTENKESAQAGDVVGVGGAVQGTFNHQTNAPTSEVFDIILTHARYHGIEFQDPNSYQSRAAKFVEDTAVLSVHTPKRLVQRYALACIYFATNGVENQYTLDIYGAGNTRNWIDETGWLVLDNECDWYQVTCDINGWVTKIELFKNRLSGAFPPETALLKDSLETIDLYQNQLHNAGDVGNRWLGEMTNLKELFFGRNNFEYAGIPTVIGQLTNLVEFDCSYTLYNGPLVNETFAYLKNLEYLHMGGNRYNSSLPLALAVLPSLKYLYVEYTDLTGDLSFMKHMPEIVELWMDRNPMMGGTIPSEIGQINSLKSFSVTDCNLEGTLPTELANLRLHQFWCYDNHLTGTIPTEFGRLGNLVRLGVEGNNLQGTMPQEICQNRVPNGLLMKLEADCQEGGSIQCSSPECCTCCGPECSGAATPSS